jgi:hypothetical protein
MLGHIASYDDTTQSGFITDDEDTQHPFTLSQWTAESAPKTGLAVDFNVDDDGQLFDIGPASAFIQPTKAVKRRWVAAPLGLAFGALGLHRIYLGHYRIALAQIAVTWVTGGYGVVWGFVEGALIITGHIYKDAKGRPLK